MKSLFGSILLLALFARVGSAHVPFLHGHLVDLTGRADRVVVARTLSSARRPAGDAVLSVRVESTLTGPPVAGRLEILSQRHLAPGSRNVLFLSNESPRMRSLAPAGASFECVASDEASYRSAVRSLRTALRAPEAERPAKIRAALLPALRSGAETLRYEAAMELEGLARSGHPPSAAEAKILRTLAAGAETDPALGTFLKSILESPSAASPH